MAKRATDDIRRTPAYPFAEAAHYLNLPVSTLRAWCLGQQQFKALIELDGEPRQGLSFLNLIEAHVLAAIRRAHGVPMPTVRKALDYVSRDLKIDRPLVHAEFQTNGVDLFVEKLGLVNVSQAGQLEMASLIELYLQRVERDAKGVPIKLYPFTTGKVTKAAPSPVIINPFIAFGRPVLKSRNVPTAVLADRFKAGDSLQQIAEDYDTTQREVEEAIRCELDRSEAA